MKRFRMKAVGLGLALAAGAGVGVAADGPPAGAPGVLPAAVGNAGGGREPEPVWLAARDAPPVIQTAAGVAQPVSVYPQVQPAVPATALAPRDRSSASAQLPAIPVAPSSPAAQPDKLPELPRRPAGRPASGQPDPVPPPRPVETPPKMNPPKTPGYLPPVGKGDQLPPPRRTGEHPLPQPRPLDPRPLDAQPELPTAPPELMLPAGAHVPGKHGTFGSPPLRLSRDYPPLREVLSHGGAAGHGCGHAHDGIDLGHDGTGGGPAGRFFFSGEYLLWWMPGFAVPVLATTNPDPALRGFLGEPGTTAIVGPGRLIDNTRSGLRIRGGAWLDDCGACGIDAGFFFLPNRTASSVVTSDRFPTITRPVFAPNLVPGMDTPIGETGEAVAVPGTLRGVLTVSADSRLWGADVNLRKALCGTCDTRAEVFAGYRHLNLRESLTITEDITVIGTGGGIAGLDPVGTRVVVQDRFATRNYFHGGQLGALYGRRWGRWELDARASVALGSTHQVAEISAFQVRQRPDAPAMNFTGGLLGAGPNIGRFERDRFSVAPEFTLNFGYLVTPNLRVFAGYNFLLWTNVIRPGDQIDRVVDLTFVPNGPPGVAPSGLNRPQPTFTQRDLVINGIQFGFDLRW